MFGSRRNARRQRRLGGVPGARPGFGRRAGDRGSVVRPRWQGSAGGVFADLDEGEVDLFSHSPEFGPGIGNRGEGPEWVEISLDYPGFGVVPLQPAKPDPDLAMDPSNRTTAKGGVVRSRARPADAAGKPMRGRDLTFAIEYKSIIAGTIERWHPFEIGGHGFTDPNGSASGFVDLDLFKASWGGDVSGLTLRIAARYADDETYRFALATMPFQITG